MHEIKDLVNFHLSSVNSNLNSALWQEKLNGSILNICNYRSFGTWIRHFLVALSSVCPTFWASNTSLRLSIFLFLRALLGFLFVAHPFDMLFPYFLIIFYFFNYVRYSEWAGYSCCRLLCLFSCRSSTKEPHVFFMFFFKFLLSYCCLF